MCSEYKSQYLTRSAEKIYKALQACLKVHRVRWNCQAWLLGLWHDWAVHRSPFIAPSSNLWNIFWWRGWLTWGCFKQSKHHIWYAASGTHVHKLEVTRQLKTYLAKQRGVEDACRPKLLAQSAAFTVVQKMTLKSCHVSTAHTWLPTLLENICPFEDLPNAQTVAKLAQLKMLSFVGSTLYTILY